MSFMAQSISRKPTKLEKRLGAATQKVGQGSRRAANKEESDMAVYKRGGTWRYEFIFTGKRVRESAKTSRKTIALEAERQRRLELERRVAR